MLVEYNTPIMGLLYYITIRLFTRPVRRPKFKLWDKLFGLHKMGQAIGPRKE